MFGAHLDHIGYRQAGGASQNGGGCRRTQEADAAQAATPEGGRDAAHAAATPQLPALDQQDTINNGADDDGSGSAALMAVAKAFTTGPKPRRSIVLVWHAGEESGLYGSRYNADFPVVPLDRVQAQLNMDMIGRNDCDNANGDYSNTVFVVGADRISTDLHNLIVDTNAAKANPLTLDYELNDPNDPENIYSRSDHYSYALKGIPIAFFTTGLHKDYHQVSDTVDKILFPKTGAHHTARVRDRLQPRKHRSRPRTRQQGPAQREGVRGSPAQMKWWRRAECVRRAARAGERFPRR